MASCVPSSRDVHHHAYLDGCHDPLRRKDAGCHCEAVRVALRTVGTSDMTQFYYF
jgi:hypothetical protein